MKRTKTKAPPTTMLDQLANGKEAMSLAQIEERLVKSILSGSLALHILRNSRKPTSRLVNDLLEIEMEVGFFVGQAMQMHSRSLRTANLDGMLASALSFIPMHEASAQNPSQSQNKKSKPKPPRSKSNE